MKSTMERKKKQYGSRLFQLALNDVVQTNLSFISPARSWMEMDKLENRKNKCIDSKLSFQTDMSKRVLKSISSDELSYCKDGKMLDNHDDVSVSPNRSTSKFSMNFNTKKCQLKGTLVSHSDKETIDLSTKNIKEIPMDSCNLESKKEDPRLRSSLFNGFECTWLCEPDDSCKISDKSKHSIDLNSKEWNDIKTKGANSTESIPDTNIDYDLPVFPQKMYIPSDFKEIGSLESFNGYLNSTVSEKTQDSLSEEIFSCIKTSPIQFLQDSILLRDFPHPIVVTSEQKSAKDSETSPPLINSKTLSKSCGFLNKPKCMSDKSNPKYGSGTTLGTVINDNSLTDRHSLKCDPNSTLNHFKCLLPEDYSSEWFDTFQRRLSRNYFFNESNGICPIPKPHPVNSKASEVLILKDQINFHKRQSLPNFNTKTANYTYSSNSGLLEHFSEFKSNAIKTTL